MRDRIWLEFTLQKIRTHFPGTRVWFASLLKHKERARSHLRTRSEAGRVERLALVTFAFNWPDGAAEGGA